MDIHRINALTPSIHTPSEPKTPAEERNSAFAQSVLNNASGTSSREQVKLKTATPEKFSSEREEYIRRCIKSRSI